MVAESDDDIDALGEESKLVGEAYRSLKWGWTSE